MTDEEPELAKWFVWYMSCEGNRRWYPAEFPADWQQWQVEQSVEKAEGRTYP